MGVSADIRSLLNLLTHESNLKEPTYNVSGSLGFIAVLFREPVFIRGQYKIQAYLEMKQGRGDFSQCQRKVCDGLCL